jgi:hypothetical protein
LYIIPIYYNEDDTHVLIELDQDPIKKVVENVTQKIHQQKQEMELEFLLLKVL